MKNKIIIALSVAVLALGGYQIYDSFNGGMSKAEVQSQFVDLKSDYQFMQKDLDSKINELNINDKLIYLQKQKIESLFKKNSISEEELLEAKKILRSISQAVYNNFINKISDLEREKSDSERIRTKDELTLEELRNKIKSLEVSKNEINAKYILEKKVSQKKDQLLNYASNLSLSNFVLKSFKVKSSGKEIETDRASRIKRIKVSFDINENMLAKSGKKQLYIVVYKPDGSLATFDGKATGSIMADKTKINYSDTVSIDYTTGETKTIEMVWDNEEFKRGDYVLEIYEQNQNKITKIGKAIKTLE